MILDVILCVFAADLLSGLVHWAEDTYGTLNQPVWIRRLIIEPNIEHHRLPWRITYGSYWQTNRAAVIPCAMVALLLLGARIATWQPYLFLAITAHLNQVHKWAHLAKSERTTFVKIIQRIGIAQSRAHHALHHVPPMNNRYCVLTNHLNPILDAIGCWRTLERVVKLFGVTVKRGTAARGED